MAARQKGFSAIELLIVVVICGLLLAIGVPPLLRFTARERVRTAAVELEGVLRLARSTAVRSGVNVGVKFRTEPGGEVTFTLYRDGDGDGVRTADIAAGVDLQIGVERRLQNLGPRVGFGFPPGPPPRDPGDPGRRLRNLDDPIRFNSSDIASFGPLGTSTPGSLYVTDHRDFLAAVRVLGRTGRVRVLRYDAEAEEWRRN
jgi:prepilin-type N-terminal cleavage/methylation domain-containing protein